MEPVTSRPASESRPGLSEIMVTVMSAITQAPGAWPVWALSPEGTSTATTRQPEWLTTSIHRS